jgi:hypothetical protein
MVMDDAELAEFVAWKCGSYDFDQVGRLRDILVVKAR